MNEQTLSDGSSKPDRVLVVVPARHGSTRLAGKVLLDRTGKPVIQHVVERVQQARHVGRVVVATDDERIANVVRGFAGEVVMTRADHPNGTSRIAEAVGNLGGDGGGVVVNVQGDEPEIEPGVIDALVEGFAGDPHAVMGTVASPFGEGEDAGDANIVKVVVDQRGRALYFSRACIPHDRDGGGVERLKHVGIYAYRQGFLQQYVQLASTPMERAESLEQLRALEHGYAINVVRANVTHHGIDTAEDYEAFVKRVGGRES